MREYGLESGKCDSRSSTEKVQFWRPSFAARLFKKSIWSGKISIPAKCNPGNRVAKGIRYCPSPQPASRIKLFRSSRLFKSPLIALRQILERRKKNRRKK